MPVDWTFDEQIWMSTTDKDSLTTVFDDNHGPDKTLVHDGVISYPVLASGPTEGPRDLPMARHFKHVSYTIRPKGIYSLKNWLSKVALLFLDPILTDSRPGKQDC